MYRRVATAAAVGVALAALPSAAQAQDTMSPVLNAATYGTNDDAFVLVHSALVDHMSDAELLNVIGHECGHIHNNHVVYLTAMHYLTHLAGLFAKSLSMPAMLGLRAWSRRAEITCDRAGALCAKDVDVALDDSLIGGWRLEGRGNLVDASFKKSLLDMYNRTTQKI